jgi:hypothetical protein
MEEIWVLSQGKVGKCKVNANHIFESSNFTNFQRYVD